MWNRKKTIIIAGCSRFGAGLAGELSEHGDDVIIIDMDNDAFRKLPPNFSGFQIVGNVTDPDLLEDAGIGNASDGVCAGVCAADAYRADRLVLVDLSFPLDNERQCRRHHAPNVEGAVVQHGKQSCGIDPNQPGEIAQRKSCQSDGTPESGERNKNTYCHD